MPSLDDLIRELAQRFGLGDRAAPLVSAFLAFLTDGNSGGIDGFLDQFRRAGLGDHVTSWLGRGPNAELSPDQLEGAIGRERVDRIAVAAGTSLSSVRPALAFLVPRAIDLITPDGIIPATLPVDVAGFARIGAAARDMTGSAPSSIGASRRRTAAAVGAEAGGFGLHRLIPLLALLLISFLGWQLLGRRAGVQRQGEQTATVTDSVYTEPAAPADPVATPTSPAPGNRRAAVAAAMQRATDALAALRPGYSARDLVSALNLNIINFTSGSAEIPVESRDVLDRSARAIRGAPPGTVLEVGGHTDSTGSAAANERLSMRRAAAVRAYLVEQGVNASALQGRGYGWTNPIADNGTDAGRFRNRRIEFTVVR